MSFAQLYGKAATSEMAESKRFGEVRLLVTQKWVGGSLDNYQKM